MAPTTSVSRSLKGHPQVRLQGSFPHPHWVAFLFSGLSNLKVSVIAGMATRGANQEWDARFDLDFTRSEANPESLDYLALAQQQTSLAFQPPQISRFQISRRFDQALEVVLQAPDQIGFLGRMLVKMSMMTLFPTEMQIDTINGQINDRIVFRSIGMMPPTSTVEESLEAMLRGLMTTV